MFEWTYLISSWVSWLAMNVFGLFLLYLLLVVPILRIFGTSVSLGRGYRTTVGLGRQLFRLVFGVVGAGFRFLYITLLTVLWSIPFWNNFIGGIMVAIRGTRLPIQTPQQAEELRETLRRGEWRRRVQRQRRWWQPW